MQKLFPKTPLLKLGYLVGLPNYSYRSSAIVSEEKPVAGFAKVGLLRAAPGTRMSHLWMEHQRKKISTLDLVGNGFVLFTVAENVLWERIADIVGNKFDIKILVYSLIKDGRPIFAGKTTFKALGITDKGAVLVRPDGFVAWRDPDVNAESLKVLEDAMTQILSIEINDQKKQTKVKEAAW